jgi:hypothetical protein
MARITPYVALSTMRTFDEVVTNANRTSGLLSWLSVLFGVLAAAPAILGIYSVMSYTVAQHERELAIRAAVGANRSTLLSMVLREGLILSGAGIAAGALIALAASGVLRSLLYQVSATDPIVFAGSALDWLHRDCGLHHSCRPRSQSRPVTALRGKRTGLAIASPQESGSVLDTPGGGPITSFFVPVFAASFNHDPPISLASENWEIFPSVADSTGDGVRRGRCAESRQARLYAITPARRASAPVWLGRVCRPTAEQRPTALNTATSPTRAARFT